MSGPDAGALEMPRGAQHGRGLRNRYTASQVVILLGVYWRIHGDYSTLDHARRSAAEPVRQCLTAAKETLEGRRPDTLAAAGYLCLADRLLLRVLPDDLLAARCDATATGVGLGAGARPSPAAEALRAACAGGVSSQDRRAALDAVIAAEHDAAAGEAIEDSLQVRRLQHLLTYCGLLAVLLFVVSPLLSPAREAAAWAPAGHGYVAKLVLPAGLAILGAVGGLFSRLLQVRDGRTSLLTYRTDMLKLGLSPLVGAMAALVVQLLAAWDVIAVLRPAGPGGIVLMTLVAGFSEKYVLRLISPPAYWKGGEDANTDLGRNGKM